MRTGSHTILLGTLIASLALACANNQGPSTGDAGQSAAQQAAPAAAPVAPVPVASAPVAPVPVASAPVAPAPATAAPAPAAAQPAPAVVPPQPLASAPQPVVAPTAAPQVPPALAPQPATVAPNSDQSGRPNPGFQTYVRNTKSKKAQLKAKSEAQTSFATTMRKNSNLAAVLKAGYLKRKSAAAQPTNPAGTTTPTGTTPPATVAPAAAVSGSAATPAQTNSKGPATHVNSASPKVGHLCDKEDVKAKLASTQATLDSCYSGLLATTPGLHGTVTVEFIVQAGGALSGPRVHKNDSNNAKLAECVLGVFKTLKFNAPKGNLCVIRWPVSFEPETVK